MKDLKKSFQLMTFGFKARTNLIMCGIFLVIGLLFEIGINLEIANNPEGIVWQPLGSVFLACMPLFGVQMLSSLTASSLVNTSPASRSLKTNRSFLAAGIVSLILFAVQVVMKTIICLLYPAAGSSVWLELVDYAAINALLLIFTAFLFRFFLATFLALYLAMFAFGTYAGYTAAMTGEEYFIMPFLPQFESPALYILLAAIILAAGLAAFYALSLLLYKIPYSKMAFGAGLKLR